MHHSRRTKAGEFPAESKDKMNTPEILAVFAQFKSLTGIEIRVPSMIQSRQAFTFAHNFQPWELEVTVAWVRSQIAQNEGRNGNGLNRQSLQWKCMFGLDEEISTFQDRLGLAKEWAARSRPSLLPKAEAPAAPQPAPAPEQTWEQGAAAMRKFLQEKMKL